jgi:hypothetical protein
VNQQAKAQAKIPPKEKKDKEKKKIQDVAKEEKKAVLPSSSSSSSSGGNETAEITIDSIARALHTSDTIILGGPTVSSSAAESLDEASVTVSAIRSELQEIQHNQRRLQIELTQALIDLRVAENKLQLQQEAAARSPTSISEDTLSLYNTILPIVTSTLRNNNPLVVTSTRVLPSHINIDDLSVIDEGMIWQSLGFPTSLSAICFIARTLAEA